MQIEFAEVECVYGGVAFFRHWVSYMLYVFFVSFFC